MQGSSRRGSSQHEALSSHLCREEGGRGRPELRAGPMPPASAVGSRPRASLSFSLFHHPIFMCPSSAVCSGLGGHGTCYSWPTCAVAISGVLVESRITLGWACLLLLDLQDGWVGLHDGHDDPVNVVLQAKVDLFLLLNCFHELWEKQGVGTGHRLWALSFFLLRLWALYGRALGLGEWIHYLIAGDRADLCGQRFREGCGEEVLGALDAQVYDLSIELIVLLLQVTVILGWAA